MVRSADHSLPPCPTLIVWDAGGGFAMGAIGGGIWYGMKGFRQAPKTYRLTGALSAIKSRAPVSGGSFGVWAALYSTFHCTLTEYRQYDDGWNSMWAAAMAGGCLAVRNGPRAVLSSALSVGFMKGSLEVFEIVLTRSMSDGLK